MLAHEHYQGGKHIFPMMKASIKKELYFDEYPAVNAGIVNWPMSDIRLTSTDTEQLIDLGTHIIKVWINTVMKVLILRLLMVNFVIILLPPLCIGKAISLFLI